MFKSSGIIYIFFLIATAFVLSDWTFDEYTLLYGAWQNLQGNVAGVDFGTVYPNTGLAIWGMILKFSPLNATALIFLKISLATIFILYAFSILSIGKSNGLCDATAILSILIPFALFYGMKDLILWRGIVEIRVDHIAILLAILSITIGEKFDQKWTLLISLLAITITPRAAIPLFPIICFAFFNTYKKYSFFVASKWLMYGVIAFIVAIYIGTSGHPIEGWFEIVKSHSGTEQEDGKSYFGLIKWLVESENTWVLLLPLLWLFDRSLKGFVYMCSCCLILICAWSGATQWFMWIVFLMPLVLINIFNKIKLNQKIIFNLLILIIIVLTFKVKNVIYESKTVSDIALHKNREYILPKDAVVSGESFGWQIFRTNTLDYIMIDRERLKEKWIKRKLGENYDFYSYISNNPPVYINLFAMQKLSKEDFYMLQKFINESGKYQFIYEYYDGHGLLQNYNWRMNSIIKVK